jgi:uncharacterized protein
MPVDLSLRPTLVLGASDNPERTSFTAVQMLRAHGVPVYALGLRAGRIADVQVQKDPALLVLPQLDTVTLYMGAPRQVPFYPYLLGLHPRRLIFNPGAENPELKALAEAQGIECVEACTLVMLHFGQF